MVVLGWMLGVCVVEKMDGEIDIAMAGCCHAVGGVVVVAAVVDGGIGAV